MPTRPQPSPRSDPAALLDTRNGYVYGTAEATETQKRATNAWQSDEAVDAARRETQSAAFDALVGELEATWKGVVERYAARPATRPVAGG